MVSAGFASHNPPRSMWKLFAKFILNSAILTLPALGTGDFLPDRWLDNGGIASEMSPEFFWELELRRMAREFSAPEKRVVPEAPAAETPEGELPVRTKFTGQGDVKDFDDALKTGRIKPPDAARAKAQHEAARKLVSAANADTPAPLPVEFVSEFSDYHRGAYAFRLGAAHYAEARDAWTALLARPWEQRHYRTVWATFMLGKLALAMKDNEAVKWFRQVRELTKEGYADSLGLAADSYGWEGRSELRQGHAEAAAKLYLTQLALGDDSAIVSLKAVIPDRPSVDGVINYDGIPDEATPEERTRREEKLAKEIQPRLNEAVRSPLLRRLITAHVLATETQMQMWSYGAAGGETPEPRRRCLRWLATIEKAGLKQVEDADHLGWIAYTGGLYDEAARWLKLAPAESATTLWLRAKLLRRSGKLAEAAELMAKSLKLLRTEGPSFLDSEFTYGTVTHAPKQSAAGDLAGLHLTRGEFVQAMEIFLQATLWEDAAFVADRVLTSDELKKYVDESLPETTARPKKESDDESSPDDATRMRWLLARRLVREDRYPDARPYFPKEQRAVLDRYVAALKDGEDAKLTKVQRARAIFTAAWLARYDGMELMGTEMEPDGFVSGGNFPPGEVDLERAEGVRISTEFDEKMKSDIIKKAPLKLAIPATAAEKKRLMQSRPQPPRRFHYRHVAAGLAWRAAGLLADGTEELADVLNTGGAWIKDRDEKLAGKYFQALEHRCVSTKIGRAAKTKHWFVDDLRGPWSAPLSKEREAAANGR